MSRPVRVHLLGALYAVTSEALEGGQLFKESDDYQAYLALLEEAKARFGVRLYAYVLLPGELRLLLELTNETTISTIMHAVNSGYTKYFTKRYRHSGHIFKERFAMTLMEKAPALLRATAYVHRLPMHVGLVRDFGAYGWSSFPSYLAAADSSIGPNLRDEVQEVLRTLHTEHPDSTYQQYVQTLSGHEWCQLDGALHQHVVGSAEFCALVSQRRHRSPAPARFPEPPIVQPIPIRPRRVSSFALTASMALAFVSLCTAWVSIKNATVLRQNIHVLSKERETAFLNFFEPQPAATDEPASRLATMTVPPTLVGTTWQVQIKPMMAAVATAPQADQLRFDARKMVSNNLNTQGVSPSQYTMSAQQDGTTVWETMQMDRSGATISWQGIWSGTTMRGMLTRQMPGQPAQTFGFVGTLQSYRGGARSPHTRNLT